MAGVDSQAAIQTMLLPPMSHPGRESVKRGRKRESVQTWGAEHGLYVYSGLPVCAVCVPAKSSYGCSPRKVLSRFQGHASPVSTLRSASGSNDFVEDTMCFEARLGCSFHFLDRSKKSKSILRMLSNPTAMKRHN